MRRLPEGYFLHGNPEHCRGCPGLLNYYDNISETIGDGAVTTTTTMTNDHYDSAPFLPTGVNLASWILLKDWFFVGADWARWSETQRCHRGSVPPSVTPGQIHWAALKQ